MVMVVVVMVSVAQPWQMFLAAVSSLQMTDWTGQDRLRADLSGHQFNTCSRPADISLSDSVQSELPWSNQ